METLKPDSHKATTRRKLLGWIGLLSALPLLKLGLLSKRKAVIDCAPAPDKTTIKVLSQDGQLMEVDVSKISIVEKGVSDQELQTWVRKL